MMAVCGVIAGPWLSWGFVSLVGLIVVPACCGAMVWSGYGFMPASGGALLGFVVLQVGFVASGFGIELWHSRIRSTHGTNFQLFRKPMRPPSTWPAFGGWLPLIAFYDPPCHSDGSPWDGVEDPGYRVTTLVVGWLNRGLSILVGTPRRVTPAQALSAREVGEAVSAMDERIRLSRSHGPGVQAEPTRADPSPD